ncbi:hypothetical protein ABN034_14675 [Actinopolymorpha sp. B11F2]|uniref:hypothetical protein n=1 Tax=Actinopolymorpha sp. B11F2 TaxID=3160862 RepID=UPI0032E3F844
MRVDGPDTDHQSENAAPASSTASVAGVDEGGAGSAKHGEGREPGGVSGEPCPDERDDDHRRARSYCRAEETVNAHEPLESGTGDAVTDAFRWEWAIDQLDGHDDEQ